MLAHVPFPLAWLLWTLLMWGLWSRIRVLSGCLTSVFATLNLGTQFLTAVLSASVVGAANPTNGGIFWAHSVTFDTSAMCVILGGFVNSHGDHLAATAMSRISPGTAFPIYSGTTLVIGTILNYVQVGSPSLSLTVLGLTLAFMAILLLSRGQTIKDFKVKRMAYNASEATVPPRSNSFISSFVSNHSDTEVDPEIHGGHNDDTEINPEPHGTELYGSAITAVPEIGPKAALASCFAAACSASLWNPLSTFAHTHRKPGPCEMMFLFGIGSLLAVPSVVLVAMCLESTSARALLGAWRGLGSRQVFFCALCGLMVNSGFNAFFIVQDQVQETVAFAIISCAGLVAILSDAICCACRGTPRNFQVCFVSAALCYVAAIGVLSLEADMRNSP